MSNILKIIILLNIIIWSLVLVQKSKLKQNKAKLQSRRDEIERK